MARKPEYPPLLPAGFHDMTLKALRDLCVDRFPLSKGRPTLMDGFERLVNLFLTKRVPGRFWVDGSFLTEDIEPSDVDIVLALHLSEWDTCEAEPKLFIESLTKVNLKPQFGCHANAWIMFPEGHPLYWKGVWMQAYWIKQWGFARSDEMKGIAVVSLASVIVT
jgi:hypothetical protein